jgi:hypothetical protein
MNINQNAKKILRTIGITIFIVVGILISIGNIYCGFHQCEDAVWIIKLNN